MIIVAPYERAQETAKKEDVSSVLSIVDDGEEAPVFDIPSKQRHLTLHLPMACTELPQGKCEKDMQAMIKQIIEFGKTHDWATPLLIHCKLGLSRSPAAALIIMCALSEAQQDLHWAELLRSLNKCIEPNFTMIAEADEVLNRDGALLDALDEMGYSTRCSDGDVIKIDFSPAQQA